MDLIVIKGFLLITGYFFDAFRTPRIYAQNLRHIGILIRKTFTGRHITIHFPNNSSPLQLLSWTSV